MKLSRDGVLQRNNVTLGEMMQGNLEHTNMCPNCTISDRQDVGSVYIVAADISTTCYCYFTV